MAGPAAAGAQPYRDRTVGLVLFGILEALVGLFFLFTLCLGALGSALAENLPQDQQVALSPRAMLPFLIFELLIAVYFIWLGIGSMLARRWARALLLVTSWICLLTGLIACLFLVVVVPDLLEHALQNGGAAAPEDAEAVAFFKGCGGIFMALFFLGLPLLLVIFYRRRNVKATCEARDPKVRWTDRCPTPVLGLSLTLGLCAVGALASTAYGAMPVFGRIVSGAPAAALALALAFVLAVLSRATCQLRPWSWWAVLVVTLLVNVSIAVTAFSSISWLDLYRDMGLPTAQVESLGLDHMLPDPRLFWFYAGFLVVVFSFLFWVERFFRSAGGPPPGGAVAGAAAAAGG